MTQPESLNHILELIPFPPEYLSYNKRLLGELYEYCAIGRRARGKGVDPVADIETKVAYDLAERVEHLVDLKVAPFLRERLGKMSRERAALTLSEEVALGRFGYLETEKAVDFGVRVGLATVTDGITVAPIQGIDSIKLKRNEDGSNYVAISFAGPIRSAGGTEAAFSLVIADHIRRSLGLGSYRPNAVGDDEVGRFIEELRIYERDVGNLQYRVSEADVRHALLHLPVEVDGVGTDPVEVIVHRGLKRIATDRVRGGALRVLNDGVIGRCRKLLHVINELSIPEWDWLAELRGGSQEGSEETRTTGSHFDEVISGRPILSSPGKPGGFRLRYGRCFTTGLSTVGIHPSVGEILDYPVVTGTQVKIDVPSKAATIALVDTIEPPIVKLHDESVVRVGKVEDARGLSNQIESVLYLGDVLVSFGDFLENNIDLLPSAYVEEWWAQELSQVITETHGSVEACAGALDMDSKHLMDLVLKPVTSAPSCSEAFLLSDHLPIALHPKYLFFWDFVLEHEVEGLRMAFKVSSPEPDSCLLLAQKEPGLKDILERAGIPHRVEGDGLIVEGEEGYSLMRTLGLGSKGNILPAWKGTLALLSMLSGVPIRRKASTFLGLRVGRPEKAMPRRMKPPVHVLFPISNKGGPTRDIIEASRKEAVEVEIVNRACKGCGSPSLSASTCPRCGGETRISTVCSNCGREMEGDRCPICRREVVSYRKASILVKDALDSARKRLHQEPGQPLKGVQGLSNAKRIPEALEKGILRQRHDLTIYKDGTIRFDATNAPLTHFTPRQIGASADRLRGLGYEKDIEGKPVEGEDQILELLTQDVILPIEAGDYLLRTSKFIDELLSKVYGEEPLYRVDRKEDLIGKLVVGLAPHTSVGIIGRLIGFTTAQVCFAHPYWHSAKRRDCDGDGDSVMLLMDVLLNFSREFLPDQIGGMMDAPLLLQPLVLPKEIQRQAHNFDVSGRYPIEFYQATQKGESPQKLTALVDVVRNRLDSDKAFHGMAFTHTTTHLISRKTRSSYATLETLPEKLERQIELAEKIRAVEPVDVVSSVLKTHLIPDIVGNMKAYVSQRFRCKSCGTHYRRPPLLGVCLNCKGELQATVTKGSVEKYLSITQDLCRRFDVGDYLRTRVELASKELASLFPNKQKGQLEITSFFMQS